MVIYDHIWFFRSILGMCGGRAAWISGRRGRRKCQKYTSSMGCSYGWCTRRPRPGGRFWGSPRNSWCRLRPWMGPGCNASQRCHVACLRIPSMRATARYRCCRRIHGRAPAEPLPRLRSMPPGSRLVIQAPSRGHSMGCPRTPSVDCVPSVSTTSSAKRPIRVSLVAALIACPVSGIRWSHRHRNRRPAAWSLP